MTDLAIPPAAVPEPAAIPEPSRLDLAPDQVAAMREQWVSFGLDPAKFDLAAAGGDPTVQADPSSAVEVLADLKIPNLSPAQAHEMVEALLKAGVPQAEVDAALREDGYEPAAVDARTDDQKEFDAAMGGATPDAYRIDYMGRVPGSTDAAGLAEFHAAATNWLAALGFPEQIGPAVIERAVDAGQRYNRMSGPQQELWRREQASDFERLAGSPERAEELRRFAARVLERGPKGFTDAMRGSGSLDDAGVLIHLAHQGERLAARG